VSTYGYGGRKVSKTVKVYTNDPQQEISDLKISGDVEKFVTITPNRVRMNGLVGHTTRKTVSIVPEKKFPFKVLSTEAEKGKDIRYQLKEKKEGYELDIETTKMDEGYFGDKITLKTDSKVRPEIQIQISGKISDPEKLIQEKNGQAPKSEG